MARVYPVNLEGQITMYWRAHRWHLLHGRWDSAKWAMERVDDLLDLMLI